MTRLFLYTKDVQLLTGKGRTASLKVIAAIKNKCSKTKHQQITVEEFCAFTGLTLELVIAQLN